MSAKLRKLNVVHKLDEQRDAAGDLAEHPTVDPWDAGAPGESGPQNGGRFVASSETVMPDHNFGPNLRVILANIEPDTVRAIAATMTERALRHCRNSSDLIEAFRQILSDLRRGRIAAATELAAHVVDLADAATRAADAEIAAEGADLVDLSPAGRA